MPSRRMKIAFGIIVALSLPAVLAFATLRHRAFRIACQRKDWDRAIEIRPTSAPVWAARGNARKKKGDLEGAIADFTQAIAIDSALVPAYNDRGNAFGDKGDFDSAITDHTRAITLDPKYGRAWINRGIIRSRKGDLDGAIADYSRAIELQPNWAPTHYNRGNTRKDKGDLDGAIADYTRAIEIEPQFARAYNGRGVAHKKKGDIAAAVANYEKAIELDVGHVQACNNLAWVMATSKEAKFRDGRRAIDLARRAGLLAAHVDFSILGTMAAAYAEAERFDRAIQVQEEAIKRLPAGDDKIRADYDARLELYRAGKPYRE